MRDDTEAWLVLLNNVDCQNLEALKRKDNDLQSCRTIRSSCHVEYAGDTISHAKIVSEGLAWCWQICYVWSLASRFSSMLFCLAICYSNQAKHRAKLTCALCRVHFTSLYIFLPLIPLSWTSLHRIISCDRRGFRHTLTTPRSNSEG